MNGSVHMYSRSSSRVISRDGNLSSLFYIADAPAGNKHLRAMFQDALEIFKVRVHQLGRLEEETTKEQQNALQVMLSLLIESKELYRETEE